MNDSVPISEKITLRRDKHSADRLFEISELRSNAYTRLLDDSTRRKRESSGR